MTKQPEDVASMVYFGLYALQHRGQESCGIVVNDDGVFASHKDMNIPNDLLRICRNVQKNRAVLSALHRFMQSALSAHPEALSRG